MPLRVMGYDGASYRAELHQKDRYPVITLVLYFGDRPWGSNKCLSDVVEIPEALRQYVNDYKINLFEIAHLPEEAINHFHSDFKVVVDYFIHKRANPEYRPKDPEKFKHVDELLKLMSVLTHDDRFVEVLNQEGGKPENMCEVLDYVEAKGRAQGLAEGCRMLDQAEAKGRAQGLAEGRREGRQEGMQEGRQKGMLEGMLNVLSGLVKDGILTASEAAKRANLSQTEFLKRTKTSEE